MNLSQESSQSNPSVKDVDHGVNASAKKEQDMQAAAAQLSKINENEKKIRESNKKWELNPRALGSLVLLGLILIIPFPRNAGGDIEIEGSSASNQAFLRPAAGGVVEQVFVKTGEKVAKGQKIAELRNWELDEKILNTEKELVRLQTSVDSLSAQESVARAEYQRAVQNSKRNKSQSQYFAGQANKIDKANLPARLDVTKSELDKVELQTESLVNKAALHKYLAEKEVYPAQMAQQSEYEAAASAKQAQSLKSELKAQKEDLVQNSNVKGYESSEAENAAKANYHRAQVVSKDASSARSQIAGTKSLLELYRKQKESLTLISPLDGNVLTLKIDSLIGQSFNRGDNVIAIGNLEAVKIKIQLPEQEIAYVEPKQEVIVRFIGIPDRVFKGSVEQIAPITSEINEQVQKKRIFEVSVILQNDKSLLKPGMTGYATIHTKKWRSLASQAWDETYRVFKLGRFINQNPFSQGVN